MDRADDSPSARYLRASLVESHRPTPWPWLEIVGVVLLVAALAIIWGLWP